MSGGQSLTITVPAQRGGDITHLGIIDRGSQPITVTSHASLLSKAANGCANTAAKGITITPNHFTVQPGQTVDTIVRIPSGTPTGDYAAVYYASAGTGKGNAHVTGAVGAQLHWHSALTVSCAHHVAAVAPSSGGFPFLFVLAGVLALVLALAAVVLVRRRRA